jgi:hypothetical protein
MQSNDLLVSNSSLKLVNLLEPTGYMMHQQV